MLCVQTPDITCKIHNKHVHHIIFIYSFTDRNENTNILSSFVGCYTCSYAVGKLIVKFNQAKKSGSFQTVTYPEIIRIKSYNSKIL